MIKIENKELANYVMFKLDKIENEFTESELNEIDEIVLSPININDEYVSIDINIINYFTNLKKIFIKNLFISNDYINNLKKFKYLKRIYFEKCEFEDENKIVDLNLEQIELINCDIWNYEFLYKMNNINSLTVVNGNVSIEKINNLKKLIYLQVSYSNIEDIMNINLPLLEEIHIDNTNINDISIVNNLEKLKKIGISEEQFIENKELVRKLIDREIIVLNENIVEFNERGDFNG